MYLRAEKFVSRRETVGVIKEPDGDSIAADLIAPGMAVMEIGSAPNPDLGVYDQIVNLIGVDADLLGEESPFLELKFTVGYWRKANAIHAWFVSNVQGGEDECRTHPVSREELKKLRESCLRVLAGFKDETHGRAVAEEHLPTQEGFFFGVTEYSEWYVQDLEDTVRQIDRVLKLPDDWSFEYQSSW